MWEMMYAPIQRRTSVPSISLNNQFNLLEAGVILILNVPIISKYSLSRDIY